MDADFSHDPRDVPRLIAAARDADLVLGSRYVPGGGRRPMVAASAVDQPQGVLVCPAHAGRAGA